MRPSTLSWVLLPRDEAIARWRAGQRATVVTIIVAALVAALAVIAARANVAAEAQLAHFPAVVIDAQDDQLLVEWVDRDTRHLVYDEGDEGTRSIGDEVTVVYPVGRPEDATLATASILYVPALVLVALVATGSALGVHYRLRPRRRQIALAQFGRGSPRDVELVDDNGRWVVLQRDERPFDSTRHIGGVLAVPVGGRGPLPPSPCAAVVRGEVRRRSIVCIEIDGELLNTYGVVQHLPDDALHGDE